MLAWIEPAWDSNCRVLPGQQPRFMPAHNDWKYRSFLVRLAASVSFSYEVPGGSLVFVRLVPLRIPIPIMTMTPTAIHS